MVKRAGWLKAFRFRYRSRAGSKEPMSTEDRTSALTQFGLLEPPKSGKAAPPAMATGVPDRYVWIALMAHPPTMAFITPPALDK